jgi:hypothetical protein
MSRLIVIWESQCPVDDERVSRDLSGPGSETSVIPGKAKLLGKSRRRGPYFRPARTYSVLADENFHFLLVGLARDLVRIAL